MVALGMASFADKDLNECNNWLRFYNLQDKDFTQIGIDKQIKIDWKSYDLTAEGKKEYESLYFYSTDSAFFLDLDSYSTVLDKDPSGKLVWQGGDPESKLQLIKTKDFSAATLLFFGSDGGPETAIWRNKNLFEVFGFTTPDGITYIPTIWKYDLNKKILKEFESKKTFITRPKSYKTEVRLRRINQK